MIENHSKSDDPHKIYEITIPGHGAVYNSTTANPTLHPISPGNQDIDSTTRTLFEELDLYQDKEDLQDFNCEEMQGIIGEMDSNKALSAEQSFYNNATLPEGPLDGAAAAAVPVFQEGAYAAYGGFPPYTAAGGQVEQVQSQPAEDPKTFQTKILEHFSYNSFQTEFEVKIYYRGNLVQTTMVTNPHGFCITAEQHPGEGGYLDRVHLPQPESVVSNMLLVEVVNHLLRKLKEGTLVEVREGAICAKRFGLCRSYWSMTNTPKEKIPNQIDKTEYTVLYSIQQFITELIDFVEQRRKESPQYSIWICLGEQWPDHDPWDKKCVMVQVTPVTMRLLHELSYSTGASSLTNSDINLEISDSLSSRSSLLSLLRSIEDMMDWE